MAKEKMVYGVVVCRTDGNHIQIIESTDYDKCYECWNTMQFEWTTASKEQRPFRLEDPVVTAFSPSMIYEIKLIPVMTEEMSQTASKNPYAQRMSQQGLSQTFPSAGGIDLLSR